MEESLLSIGELAARSGLSPKALRLYDESGLLVPRRVDPSTGYRSYGTDQVGRARLIAALRQDGTGDRATVLPPSWRPDVEGKADLVEEIVRIAGLDRIVEIDEHFGHGAADLRADLDRGRRLDLADGGHDVDDIARLTEMIR